MRKTISVLLAIVVLLLNQFAYAYSFEQIPVSLLDDDAMIKQSSISADAAIVLDVATNTVLFSKNIDEKLAPAGGLTMLFASLVALDTVKLTDVVTCTSAMDGLGSDVKKLGLKNSDQITVYDLISAILIRSNVDAVVALAIHTAGSEDAFVEKLNQKAGEMGLTQTLFKNCTGLQISGQVTSASDMMEIAKLAYSNDTIREIVAKPTYKIASGSLAGQEIVSVNEFLSAESQSDRDSRVNGMVYATLSSSNSSAVTTATVGERDVLVVLLKDSSKKREKSIVKLLDYAYEEFAVADLTLQALAACDILPIIDGMQPTIDSNYEVKVIGHKDALEKLDREAPKLAIPNALPQNVTLSLGDKEVAKVDVVAVITPTPMPTATPVATTTPSPTNKPSSTAKATTVAPAVEAAAIVATEQTTQTPVPTTTTEIATTEEPQGKEIEAPTIAPIEDDMTIENPLLEEKTMTENIVFNLNALTGKALDGMSRVRAIMDQLGWILYAVAGGVALVLLNIAVALIRISRRNRRRHK